MAQRIGVGLMILTRAQRSVVPIKRSLGSAVYRLATLQKQSSKLEQSSQSQQIAIASTRLSHQEVQPQQEQLALNAEHIKPGSPVVLCMCARTE